MNGTARTTSGKVKLFNGYQGADTGRTLGPLTVFQWIEKRANWLKMANGDWINCGSTWQYASILTYPTTTEPPPPPIDPPNPPPAGGEPTLTNTIEVFDDGTIDVTEEPPA
jgi:hypothetical protein